MFKNFSSSNTVSDLYIVNILLTFKHILLIVLNIVEGYKN